MLKKLKQFALNTHDLWKLLALALMIIDHTGFYVLGDDPYFRIVGRLSFPIFAIIYGYHFRGKLNYSLLLYGLPLIFIEYYTFGDIFFNILYSFFLGAVLINIYNKLPQKFKIPMILTMAIAHFFIVSYLEYGSFAFFFMLAAQQTSRQYKIISFAAVFLYYYILQSLSFGFNNAQMLVLLGLLTIEAVLLYNYRNVPIKIGNMIAENSIKFLGRYTLQIYVLQNILFQLYYKFA